MENQKNKIRRLISLFKDKKLAVAIFGIALIAVIATAGVKKKNGSEIFLVSRGDVSQEIMISGVIKAMDSVDLAFEKTGTVEWISKKVGEFVYAGEVVASLENGTEEASLENAKAQMKSEIARYEELAKGSRLEELRIKETEIEKAEQDLKNFYSEAVSSINNAFNKSDDAVNKQTDAIFSNDQTTNPDITFNVSNQQIRNEAISERIVVFNILKDFNSLNNSVLSGNYTSSEKEKALTETRNYLIKIQAFLVKVSTVLDNASNLSDETLASYKGNVSTGRNNVNAAILSISDIIDNIASQKITVQKYKHELDLAKIGATAEVLAQQESAIMRAEANVKSAESGLKKTVIRSPINGIITRQDAKVGEIAQAGIKLVSVINEKDFKIEASVPETDLIKLKTGDQAEVTLDAYGDSLIFSASVIEIEPAEKVIDGVSTYKTTFSINSQSTTIRSGMTANIKVKTAERKNVLFLPKKALKDKGDFYTVLIYSNGRNEERIVDTGLVGTSGKIEITSGLNEGDKVIIYPPKN